MASTSAIEQAGLRLVMDPTAKQQTGAMGKEDFLKILVAQLSHQDPMEPMKDNEFITQMTQLSTLEQFQQMTSSFTSTQSYNMVGKYVTALIQEDENSAPKLIGGKVDSVVMKSGIAYLEIGEYAVPTSCVQQVLDKDLIEGSGLQNSEFMSFMLGSANLIGKFVDTSVLGDDNFYITGLVQGVTSDQGVLMLNIGGKNVPLSSVKNIGGSAFTPTPGPTPTTDTGTTDTGSTDTGTTGP